MKLFINKSATHFFACDFQARAWLFGKKIAENNMKIIKNGIDLNKFRYDSEASKETRKLLGIEKIHL